MRAQIQAFVQQGVDTGAVSGVTRVYKAMPWFVDGSTWQLSSSLGSGAVVFAELPEDNGEVRIADPVLEGQKEVEHFAALVVLYQFLIPSAAQDTVSEDSWVDPLDATLDSLKAWIRTDPNLGNPDVIFQAAQQRGDLSIKRDPPRRTSGKVWSWNALRFRVTEIITA